MTLLKRKQVTERFGWSATTIWRKVKQGCFPEYRITPRDIRYAEEEILHHIQGTRHGSFDGGAHAAL